MTGKQEFWQKVVTWGNDPNGRLAWRKKINDSKKEKGDQFVADFDSNPHPFLRIHKPHASKDSKTGTKFAKLRLVDNGVEFSKTQGIVFGNRTHEVKYDTEGKPIPPTLSFSRGQRIHGSVTWQDLEKMTPEERKEKAPRHPVAAVYAEAKFILLEDLSMICKMHPLMIHDVSKVTTGIQTSYEGSVKNPKTGEFEKTGEKIDMPEESQICRLKLSFPETVKGWRKPTVFEDFDKPIGSGSARDVATIDGEPISIGNIHQWLTSGSMHTVFEDWDSVALTSMGRNPQIYVTQVITRHKPYVPQEQEMDDEYHDLMAKSSTTDEVKDEVKDE